MKIIPFLVKASPKLTLFSIIAGMFSGLVAASLVAMINGMLAGSSPTLGGKAGLYLTACFFSLGLATLSQMLLIHLTQATIFKLRLDLCHRILKSPLRQLEAMGSPRLLSALTENALVVTQAITTIPGACVHLTMVLGCLIYLAHLSWAMFLSVIAFAILGIAGHLLVTKVAMRSMRQAHDEQDVLFKHLRSLLDGMKELKLHQSRCQAFLNEKVFGTAKRLKESRNKAMMTFAVGSAWGSLMIFVLIGLLLFVIPAFLKLSSAVQVGTVVTIMFLIGPLANVVSFIPIIGRTNIVLEKLKALGIELAWGEAEAARNGSPTPRTWSTLELVNVTHVYRTEGEEDAFTLGPINLTFHKGEIVFLVGGNGSGKTTMAKLLCALYTSESGEIRLDGRPVTLEDRDEYRQNFSVLFNDFYLFDSLLGLEPADLDRKARLYLARFQLSHKISIKNGVFSTIDLSQGQRKRLSLITAYLEDRPFYILDEWAADQDPSFRDVFYREILIDLKSRGKTVLVITHDDRYFSLADRIIKLEYGKVVNEFAGTENSALAPSRLHPFSAISPASPVEI